MHWVPEPEDCVTECRDKGISFSHHHELESNIVMSYWLLIFAILRNACIVVYRKQ